jgi:hypothetical protein
MVSCGMLSAMTTATWVLAIATTVLAIATAVAVFVTVHLARQDRTRDDARRAEDRERDAQLRKEDRDWDAAQRQADRERDDKLRREAADEWDRRTRGEQRGREDYEARQVTVEFRGTTPQQIVISAPATYPIKQVGACIAHWTGANLGIVPIGHAVSGPFTEGGRTLYSVPAAVPPNAEMPAVLVSFVDRHGNLYYNLKNHTMRFPQATDPMSAASQIDEWLRTGPKSDEPTSP